MSWACLLKRVFEIDIEQCPRCGGRLKIIAAIVCPQVIVKILTHLGLPARVLRRAPARPFRCSCSKQANPYTQARPAQPLSRHARSSRARATMRLDIGDLGSRIGRVNLGKPQLFTKNSHD